MKHIFPSAALIAGSYLISHGFVIGGGLLGVALALEVVMHFKENS